MPKPKPKKKKKFTGYVGFAHDKPYSELVRDHYCSEGEYVKVMQIYAVRRESRKRFKDVRRIELVEK